ncbi:SH3 and multiple ankyrin repeat domains protein 3-like isoform X4 [Branchiostoma lanceolatum]|uniref:SH3 and multiple ankyrin repeat domains protein 3-like isoform X4 n=1 Tax=Branchiostoma lanceolatum TaxID=7740 RepID=UPI0034516E2E
MGTTEPIHGALDDGGENTVLVRVAIPDRHIQKCFRFRTDDTVWAAKQMVLTQLDRALHDGVNYGFFLPPENGRAGKFLDEGRLFDEYPLKGPIGYLEFKYKRRVYMAIDLDEKGLQRLHTRANLRRFLEHVRCRALDKVFRLLKKGLDPNFHDPEKGETPLTTAAMLEGSTDMIVTLVEGGAHKDFRAKDGMTPLHRAARKGNYRALKSLLELGSSPDFKDARNLTSLYHCCMVGGNPTCCEVLLHNHADPHVTDEQGWQPMHQACRHGHVQHLEHLLFYGADHTAQNASGNTPLHICALYNQEPCTRVLLFRGARRDVKNYSNQTPFQVAAVAGNFDLGEIIKKHESQDVDVNMLPSSPVEVQFRETPKYNNRRRASVALSKHLGILHRTRSCGNLDLSNLRSLSPSPSMTSLQSLGTLSLHSSLNMAPHSQHHHSNGTPAMSVSSTNSSPANSQPSTPTPGSPVTNRSATLNREDLENVKRRMYTALPGRQFVAVKKYVPREVGELALAKGDKVTVLGIGEQGFWEGRVGSNEGWFPSECVEEVSNKPTTERQGSTGHYRRLSSHSVGKEYSYYRDTVRRMKREDTPRSESPIKAFTIGRSRGLWMSQTINIDDGEEEMKKLQANPPPKDTLALKTLRNIEENTHGQVSHVQRERASTVSRATGLRMTEFSLSSNTEAGVKALREQRMHRAKTAPALPMENSYNKPRTAVLKRDQHGFGFVLRGAKTPRDGEEALNPNVPFTPTLAHPALQYMESIDPSSVAERAGLKKGDFLLQINGEDVRRFTHAQVVELIRESRDVVVMTVVTVDPQLRAALQRQKDAQKRISIAAPSSPRDEDEIVDLRREDTIAKEFLAGSTDGGGRTGVGSGGKSPNVTKVRAASMVADMTIDDKDLENLQSQLARRGSLNNMEGTRTATLRSRPSSKRVTTAELEDLFQRQDSDYQSPRALGIQPSDSMSEYQSPRSMGVGKAVPVPTVPRGKAVPVPVVPNVGMPPLPPKQRPQSAREKIATPRAAPEVEDTTVGNIVVEKIRKDSISSSTDSNSLSNASDSLSAPSTPTTPNYSEITVSFDSSVRRKLVPPPKPSHPPPPPPRTVSSSFRSDAIESKATTLPASYQDPNLHHQIKMAILNRQDSTQSLHVPQEQRRVPDMMRSNSVGGIEPQEVGNQRAALQRRVHSVTFDGTYQVREIDVYDDGQNERSYSAGEYQTPNVNASDRHVRRVEGQVKSSVERGPIVRRDVSRTERVEQSPRTRTKRENLKAAEQLREKLERTEHREEAETESDSEEGKTGLALELARAVKARKQKEKSNVRDQRQEGNASPKQVEPMKKKEIANKLEAHLQRHTSTDALPPAQSTSPVVQNKVGAYRAQVVVNHSTDDLRRSPGAVQHPDSPRSRQPISMYEQEGYSPESSSPLAMALAARARYERSSNEHLDQVEGATGDAVYEERAAHLTPIRDWYFENEEYVDMSPDMNYDTDLALALEKRRSEIGELEGVPAYNVGIEEKIERHRQAATRGEQSNSNAALIQAMAARRARMAGGEVDSNDDLPLPFDLPPPVMPEELLAAAEGLTFDEPLPPPPEFSESDQKTSYSSPAHDTHAYYTSDYGTYTPNGHRMEGRGYAGPERIYDKPMRYPRDEEHSVDSGHAEGSGDTDPMTFDPHCETISTISTVSSMSTLSTFSSDSGFDPHPTLRTKPPTPPKPPQHKVEKRRVSFGPKPSSPHDRPSHGKMSSFSSGGSREATPTNELNQDTRGHGFYTSGFHSEA